MYLQLEKGESIPVGEIVGVFDLDRTTVAAEGKRLLARAQEEKRVVSVCNDLPKSYVLRHNGVADFVYISGLSVETIRRRILGAFGAREIRMRGTPI